MVRPAHRRTQKYKTGIDPDLTKRKLERVRSVMIDLETPYLAQIAEIERKVKRICEALGVQTFEIAQYINFARQVYSKCKRFESVTLAAEVQYLVDHWVSRGLLGSLLVRIAGLFGVTPTAPALIVGCQIATGQYTGDGTLGQAITGIGFRPIYVLITVKPTGDAESAKVSWTFDLLEAAYIDRVACWMNDGNISAYYNDKVGLDDDGFTVDDAGGDFNPNKNGQTYVYVIFG